MSRPEIPADPGAAWPHLRQFLGAYFHQDWVLDHSGWEGVVADFVAESPPSERVDCVVELRNLLDDSFDNDELGTILEALGCSVEPAAFDLDAGAWLGAVLERLAAGR